MQIQQQEFYILNLILIWWGLEYFFIAFGQVFQLKTVMSVKAKIIFVEERLSSGCIMYG
jgi:hypothetical protein